jgi:hypothetical protein
MSSGDQFLDDDDDDDDDDDKLKEIPGPSSSKRLRIHVDEKKNDETKNISLCVEVKSRKTSMLHFDVFDQIIAEAITNAFTQVNNSKALSGWLIPSFGCTLDHITVFLYDPKNDILLQLAAQLPIWDKITEMSVKTIVHIWMLLNFTVFMHKNISDEYKFNCSNFHHLTGILLKEYWNLQSGEAFSTGFSYNDFYTDLLLEALETGEEVCK